MKTSTKLNIGLCALLAAGFANTYWHEAKADTYIVQPLPSDGTKEFQTGMSDLGAGI